LDENVRVAEDRGPEITSAVGGDWWSEPGERVLWRGEPQVRADYRRTLILRLGVLLLLAVVVIPLPFGGSLQERLIVAAVSAALIVVFGILFIPWYLAKLAKTRYVVTSRRGLVIVGSSPTNGYVLWVPITSKKIRIRKERNGVADISWGKPSGRLGQAESSGRNLLDGLGMLKREDREELLFVRVSDPQAALGAIRGARSAAGLQSDF
jgi:hypothetical protein